MKYTEFDERRFRDSVNHAIKSIERILHIHRNPRLAEDVEHSYENKYDLANKLTNTLIIAQMNVFEKMGITTQMLESLNDKTSTTLRFEASESCTFLKEHTIKVPVPQSIETDEDVTSSTSGSSFFSSGSKKSTITKVVNQIKEYHWKVEVSWALTMFSGTYDSDKVIPIQSRTNSVIIVIQNNKRAPLISANVNHPPIDLSLTWLLQMIDTESFTTKFSINTQHETTKTPFRNHDIEEALDHTTFLMQWTEQIKNHFQSHIEHGILKKHNPASSSVARHDQPPLRSISADNLFCPIQPLFEDLPPTDDDKKEAKKDPKSTLSYASDKKSDDDDKNQETSTVLLSNNDMHKLLNEQIRTISEAVSGLQRSWPGKLLAKVLTVAEAQLFLLCIHMEDLITMYIDCMGYLETMLQDQLVKAIGKRIQSQDLDQFVTYHNSRFLNPSPIPFCHSIRRDVNHYPDGHISIEGEGPDGKKEPIHTIVRHVSSTNRLDVPLSASTTCELTGQCYLHGWIQHRFDMSEKSYQLIARARQFSCFILVIGTMVGPTKLEPAHAIIVQNKDELLIPLLLNDLPTSKEFKDSIKSLSPEQQDFCKAFRSMQLESSVFGLCVIQVKPQLETLLGLPKDALLKEMKLTQDLMELFVEYQVPSDLLSYEEGMAGGGSSGGADITVKDKIETVKGHVQAVMDVIGKSKVKQLEDATMRADMAIEERVTKTGLPPSDEESMNSLGGPSLGGPSVGTHRLAQRASNKRGGRMIKTKSPVEYQALPGQPMMLACSAEPPVLMETTAMARSMAQPEVQADMAMAADFAMEIPHDANLVLDRDMANLQSSTTQQSQVTMKDSTNDSSNNNNTSTTLDFTLIPKQVDSTIEKHDKDGALRSTIVKTANKRWTRYRQENLLTKMKNASTLYADEIKSETNKAFDLLEALSRSGALPISCSELHVMVAVTHCFDNDVMGTVLQDNINPIEKLEKSTLLLASTIHGGVPMTTLLRDPTPQTLHRLGRSFPALLNDGSEAK